MQTVTIAETETDTNAQTAPCCAHCGSPKIRAALTRSAFWHQDKLVVVEDIPAIVCDGCHEQFFDDGTIVVLDLLRGDGFPSEQATGELRVPVFSFGERAGVRSQRTS
ncbi:MAG: YgiT-type zinc finger protein [Pseudolabrys sp.]